MTKKDPDTLLMEGLILSRSALDKLDHMIGGKYSRSDARLAGIERTLRDTADLIRQAMTPDDEDDVFEVGETDD